MPNQINHLIQFSGRFLLLALTCFTLQSLNAATNNQAEAFQLECIQSTYEGIPAIVPLTGTNLTAALTNAWSIEMSGNRRIFRYRGPEMVDAMGMKHIDGTKWLQFRVNRPATVYVDVQNVHDYLPEWLSPEYGWALSAETFYEGVVFEKHVEPGEFWLGPNAVPPGSFVERRYVAAVAPRDGRPGNNPPYARADFYNLAGASSLTVTAAQGVTANDADTNGDELTVALVKEPKFGSLSLNVNGSFTYTPGTNFTRFDSFQYQVHDGTTNGNATIVNLLNGQEMHHSMEHQMHDIDALAGEHEQVFALAPHHAATHVAMRSGNWSDPATWHNRILPVDHANVLVPAGVTLTVDATIAATLKTVRVDGVLRFAPEVETELRADTVLINRFGGFEMGTLQKPIAAGVTARLLIADLGEIDTVWDPHQFSRGLINHGRISIHGQDVTDYANLLEPPLAGFTNLLLEAAPHGWKVGDQVVIAGTAHWTHFEKRTITAIDNRTVSLDSPLQYDRSRLAPDLEIHVAHLTRNAVIKSESPEPMRRGHVMVMHSNNAQVHNAAFNDLGRSDKSRVNDDAVVLGGVLMPLSGENVRARYALHFHRAGMGDAAFPAAVSGCVVHGSPGWGFVNHSSHVIFTGNVACDVTGSAYNSEAGDELGAFRRNIAIGMNYGGADLQRSLADRGRGGHGFWIQSPLVEVTGNIVANSPEEGYVVWIEGLQQPGLTLKTRIPTEYLPDPSLADGAATISVGSVPLVNFSDNVTYASQIGLKAWNFAGTIGFAVINRHTMWAIAQQGFFINYAKRYEIRSCRLLNDMDNPRGMGVSISGGSYHIRVIDPDVRGFQRGVHLPPAGDQNMLEGGVLQNGVNVIVDYAGPRRLEVRGTELLSLPGEPDDDAMVFTTLAGGNPQFLTFDILQNASHEILLFTDLNGNSIRYWYASQAHDWVPIPEPDDKHPNEYVGLTNQELWDRYGLAVAGEIAPTNAFTLPRLGNILVTELPYFMQAPSDAVNDTITLTEDTPTTLNVLANDIIRAAGSVDVRVVDPPQHGKVRIVDGVVTYVPATNYFGQDDFTYSLRDANAHTDVARVVLYVGSANDAPIAVTDTFAAAINTELVATNSNESTATAGSGGSGEGGVIVVGGGFTGTSTKRYGVLANDSDPDGDVLSAVLVSGTAHGTLTLFTNGTFSYVPDADYEGSDSFVYEARDSSGASAQAMVNIMVIQPTNVPIGDLQASSNPVQPGGRMSFTASFRAVAPLTDYPSGTVTLRIDGVAVGSDQLYAGAAKIWVDVPGPGPHLVAVEYPGDGTFAPATATLSPQLVVNHTPVAGSDFIAREPDTGVKVAVARLLANDSDPDGDSLSFSLANAASHGTVTQSGDWIHYAPTAGAAQQDSFSYTISDGKGSSATGTVYVLIRYSADRSKRLRVTPFPDGSYVIEGNGIPMRQYQIQYADVLSPEDWVTLESGPSTAGTDGTFQAIDPAIDEFTGEPVDYQRIYRVRPDQLPTAP